MYKIGDRLIVTKSVFIEGSHYFKLKKYIGKKGVIIDIKKNVLFPITMKMDICKHRIIFSLYEVSLLKGNDNSKIVIL